MLHLRFTVLVVGLLFVLHALKSCSVHSHQGEELVGKEIVASVHKEILAGFGGRKLGGHEVVEIIGSSKNSGAIRCDGKCDLQGNGVFNVKWENNDAEMISNRELQDEANTHDQVNIGMNKLEPKTSEFGGLESTLSSRSDKQVLGQEPPAIGNRADSKMLLEAAKEIVNLIHKDYKGGDRRKPPINNHVPRH